MAGNFETFHIESSFSFKAKLNINQDKESNVVILYLPGKVVYCSRKFLICMQLASLVVNCGFGQISWAFTTPNQPVSTSDPKEWRLERQTYEEWPC